MPDFLTEFAEYIRKKYKAEPGFITMNLPMLLEVLEEKGLKNPIICTSINKIGFRMSGGKAKYEQILSQKRCRVVAMQVLAAGALKPSEAMEYVCGLPGLESILFGASSRSHIEETKHLIEKFDQINKRI